ncbi:two-component regulator propeller domain-containing protein [Chloracidobacterium aggregatum]|uniref:two-component regulator propeller domain-containing protein n=1 Tax=Chloracidobacterium aggregatum TaxID=2851959 RepID=UPI00387E8EA2
MRKPLAWHECRVDALEGYNGNGLWRATGLPAENVRSVCEDQAGRLWIGTDGGGCVCSTVARRRCTARRRD